MLNNTIHDGKKFPEKYFFFNNTNAGLLVDTETLQYKNISIVKGYTIGMWIRAEQISLDPSNKRILDSSMLFSINTSKSYSFEVYLRNRSIYYKINTNSETASNPKGSMSPNDKQSVFNLDQNNQNFHHLLDIEFGKWTMLIFSHKPWSFLQKSEFTVWKDGIDHVYVKNVEYPNLKNQKLMSVSFFKDFTGQVSNIFMMNETISNPSIIKDLSHYTFGLYNERNIRIFKDFIERDMSNNKSQSDLRAAFENMIFIYSPCRVRGLGGNVVTDLINNINSEIITTIEGGILVGGVVNCHSSDASGSCHTGISLLGGLNLLLPLFEFFTSDFFNSTNVIEEAMNLLFTVLESFKGSTSFTYKQSSTKFFHYLSLFFEAYDKSLFSREIMSKIVLLTELLTRESNSQTLAKDYCMFILFNPKIFCKFEINLQIELWKNIADLYLKRMTVMNNFFDAKDIFEMIVKVYDSDVNLYCCEEHLKMLCERQVYNKDKENSGKDIDNFAQTSQSNNLLSSTGFNLNMPQVAIPNLMNKISSLLLVIESVLTTNKLIAVDQLKQLIPYLSYEISPCLQKGFLAILERVMTPGYSIQTPISQQNSTLITSSNNLISDTKRGSNGFTSYNPLHCLDDSTRNKYILAFLKAKGLEHLLFILSISTLDVRLECLKIFDLFSRMPSSLPVNIEDELIPFLVHSLFPLRTPIVSSLSTSTTANIILHNEPGNKNSLKFTLNNEFFSDNRQNVGLVNTNVTSREKNLNFSINHANTYTPSTIECIKKATECDTNTGKISDKSQILDDLNNLNNLYNKKMKVRKRATMVRGGKDKESQSGNTFHSPLSSSMNNRYSLYTIEDDYWRIMLQNKMVKNLNIPDLYIREYSNSLNDTYVDLIYDYLMKWLVDRYEKNENKKSEKNFNFSKFYTNSTNTNSNGYSSIYKEDDSDTIEFYPAINLIMKLVMYANIVNKQKCLVDFLTLTTYNKRNCHTFIKNKYFHQWLLDLIFPYQILLQENFADQPGPSNNKQSGLAATIIEVGVKIHTNVIINSILYEQELQSQNENFFTHNKKDMRIDLNSIFQNLLTWLYKIRKLGTVESRSGGNLVRALLLHLIDSFDVQLKLMSPNNKFPIWQNFLNLTFIIYEFVIFSNFDKKLSEKRINFDSLEKNEILVEIIQNLNYDFEGNSSSEGNSVNPGTNAKDSSNRDNRLGVSMMDIWIDRELLIKLYESFQPIWHENVFKLEKKSSSTLSDEFKFIDSLVNKLIFENKPNFFIEDLKVLLTNSSSLEVSNISNMNSEHSRNNTIMRAILNIIIIIIRLSENKNEVFYWVKELEKFTLFIIAATENAKIDLNLNINEQTLTYAQEATSSSLILVFNFLIDELNSPRRREFSDELIDVFKSTLRFLFIYLTYVLEKLHVLIENDPKKRTSIFFSALTNIKNALFLNPHHSYSLYSPCWRVYTEYVLDKTKSKIFSISDIKEYRLNKYIEIPERFNTETWIHAFQENNLCYKIIKDQFNFGFFEKLLRTRLVEADNISFNVEICIKEKIFINKVYRLVSSGIKDSLFNLENKFKGQIYDYFMNKKLLEYEWRKIKKEMFTWRGKWCNLDDFLNLDVSRKIKYKIANHLTSSISRPILTPIFEIENYLPRFSKYDPITGNLFQDTKIKIIQGRINYKYEPISYFKSGGVNFNTTLSSSDDSVDNSQMIGQNLMELKVKQTTNKSIVHYNNTEFSDFVEKYSDLEKLVKYFALSYTGYNKMILNTTEMFIHNLKSHGNNYNVHIYDACYIKLKGHKKGKIVVNVNSIAKDIYFIKNIREEEKCQESLFSPIEGISTGEKIYLNIKISSVKQIYKRRYFYKKTALEIFTFSNKSYYFNFPTVTDRDHFCKLIYDNSSSKENPYLFEYHLDVKKNNNVVTRLIEEWVNWRISNFDLLMNFNNLAGRSYHDLTQYPVFPWIINEYKNSPNNFRNVINCKLPVRDLSKPIGALGSEERVDMFQTTFKESSSANVEGMIDEGNYFYNSHYSNPFYVTNFLQRVFPYTLCAIELQGDGFDNPQRQFLSMESAFHNSMTQATDVRELIPEFFYLPETFINVNKINFGKIENSPVEDVQLPPWSKDPYRFVIINRLHLESEEVSYKINEWVDLIFGMKQKGREAESSMNLFWKFTYEDEIDIDQIQKTNFDEYHSYISKIYFGQTPMQITNKPLVQRINKELVKNNKMFIDNRRHLQVFNSKSEAKNQYKVPKKDIKNKMMIAIKTLDSDKLICVFNNGVVQIMKADDTPCLQGKFIFIKEKEACINEGNNLLTLNLLSKCSEEIKRISDEDESIMKEINSNQPVKILKNGKIIIKGGYYDGKFLVFNMENNDCVYFPTDDESKVTFIESDDHEKLLFIGTSSGRIYIYDISEYIVSSNFSLLQFLNLKSVLTDHENYINYIYICNRTNIVATVANDKTCNLYTFPQMKLFKVIREESNSIIFDYAFISASPLPSVILYSKSTLSFYCYSINGQLMHVESDGVKYLFTPTIVSDVMQKDHLVKTLFFIF
jgi:hypothetical protein